MLLSTSPKNILQRKTDPSTSFKQVLKKVSTWERWLDWVDGGRVKVVKKAKTALKAFPL